MPDATSRTNADPATEKHSATGLTLPQIMASALAAATAAILGSFLGVIGTIGGAAVASVISTVGSALYQRSLERTRDAVRSRLVVDQLAGTKVADAVARVTGDAPPAPHQGQPQQVGPQQGGVPQGGVQQGGVPQGPPRPGVPGPGGPMMSPPHGAPVPPGVPTRRLANGAVVPVGPQQLRAGGRTVAARVDAAGRPMPADPTQRIPDARAPYGPPPGGEPPTQAAPPLGPDGRPLPGPTQRMPHHGPVPPPEVPPTAYLGQGPGPEDPTALAPAAPERPRRRLGRKTWITLGGVAASVFAIGILASFAVESAAGHPLSGGSSGTSVGSIFGQDTGTATTTPTSETQESGASETTTTTSSEQDGQNGSQSATTTTEAPTTTTSPSNDQNQNPLSSLVPGFSRQGAN